MRNKLLALALVSAGTVMAWRFVRDDAAPAAVDSENPVLDRLWIDKMPQSERETVNVFLAIDGDEFGLFQTSSVWRGQYEIFQFDHKDSGAIVVKYPQTGERETVRGKVRKCRERDFDYCLELSGASRGVTRYYSREEWVIDNAHTPAAVTARIDALLHAD